MALKTFHFVPGLSRTPLLFIPRYLTNICFKNVLLKQKNLENRKSGNLNIGKPRFTNKCPEGLLGPIRYWSKIILGVKRGSPRIILEAFLDHQGQFWGQATFPRNPSLTFVHSRFCCVAKSSGIDPCTLPGALGLIDFTNELKSRFVWFWQL